MSIQIASMYAKVGANTDAFERAMNGVDSRLGAVGGAFGALGSAIKTGVTLAAGAAAAGVAGLTAVIVKSTSSAADMEQRVADIGAAMNLTGTETDKVSKLISDLGLDPNLKVSATEAADVIQKLGTAGLSLDTILGGAARSTVMLANATGADFGQAASIASDSMAIFGLKAEDLDKSISNILATTQASKFKIGDYAEALAQGGGVAASVGVSFEDFNTTIAAISPLFASGSDAGTSFKTFLQRMVPQSNEAVDAMRQLGFFTGATTKEFNDAQEKLKKVNDKIAKLDPTSKNYAKRLADLQEEQARWNSVINNGKNAFFDENGQMKSMSKVAGILKKALAGLSDEQKNAALSTIFGADAMRAAVAIAQAGEEGFDSLAATMAKTDVGQAMATRMDTATGAWEIFLGVVESVQIMIGKNFLPVWKDMVQWMTNFVSANSGQINTFFEGLAARLTAVWAVFRDGGLMAALGELGKQLTYFYNQFVGWLNQSGILGQIQATLAGWSAAFAEWGIGLWNVHVWPRLVQFWDGLTSWFTDPAKRQIIVDKLASWGEAAWQWIVDMVPVAQQKLAEWGASVGKYVTDNLPAWQANLATWAEAAWKWIVDSAPKVWTKLQEWGGSVGKYVTDNLPNWQANLATWGEAAWKWIVDAGPKVSAKLSELWSNTIKPWLDEHTPGWGSTLEGWGKKFADTVAEAKAGFDLAWPKMETIVSDAQTSISGDVEEMLKSLGRLAGWFSGGGEGTASMESWATFWTSLTRIITGTVTSAVGKINDMLHALAILGDSIGAIKDGDWDKFKTLGQEMAKLMESQNALDIGPFGGLLNSLQLPGRATGGPVQAGQAYVVGEDRPEVFVPQSNGYVYPDAAGWGGERTLRVVVESPLPNNRQAIRDLALAIKREIDLTGAVMVG